MGQGPPTDPLLSNNFASPTRALPSRYFITRQALPSLIKASEGHKGRNSEGFSMLLLGFFLFCARFFSLTAFSLFKGRSRQGLYVMLIRFYHRKHAEVECHRVNPIRSFEADIKLVYPSLGPARFEKKSNSLGSNIVFIIIV